MNSCTQCAGQMPSRQQRGSMPELRLFYTMGCLMVAAGPILAAIVSSSIMQGGARKKVDVPLGLQD